MAIANFPTTTVRSIKSILKLTLPTKTPVLFHGPVGIGKSEGITQAGFDLGYEEVIMFKTGGRQSVDILGLPAVVTRKDGTQTFKFIAPDEFPREGCVPTLLGVDELYSGEEEVQVPLTELLLDRKIGQYTLPANCDVVCATNDSSHGSFTACEDNNAVNNRLLHVNVKADASEWIKDYAIPKRLHPSLIAFIQVKPNWIFDSRGIEAGNMAFATPRSLKKASDVLYQSEKLFGKSESLVYITALAMAGCVGEACMGELRHFIESEMKLRPLTDYYNAAKNLKKDPKALIKIGPKDLEGLYSLAFSLSQDVGLNQEKFILSMVIMKELCTKASKFSGKEVLSVYVRSLFDKINSGDAEATLLFSRTKTAAIFTELAEFGIDIEQYVKG